MSLSAERSQPQNEELEPNQKSPVVQLMTAVDGRMCVSAYLRISSSGVLTMEVATDQNDIDFLLPTAVFPYFSAKNLRPARLDGSRISFRPEAREVTLHLSQENAQPTEIVVGLTQLLLALTQVDIVEIPNPQKGGLSPDNHSPLLLPMLLVNDSEGNPWLVTQVELGSQQKLLDVFDPTMGLALFERHLLDLLEAEISKKTPSGNIGQLLLVSLRELVQNQNLNPTIIRLVLVVIALLDKPFSEDKQKVQPASLTPTERQAHLRQRANTLLTQINPKRASFAKPDQVPNQIRGEEWFLRTVQAINSDKLLPNQTLVRQLVDFASTKTRSYDYDANPEAIPYWKALFSLADSEYIIASDFSIETYAVMLEAIGRNKKARELFQNSSLWEQVLNVLLTNEWDSTQLKTILWFLLKWHRVELGALIVEHNMASQFNTLFAQLISGLELETKAMQELVFWSPDGANTKAPYTSHRFPLVPLLSEANLCALIAKQSNHEKLGSIIHELSLSKDTRTLSQKTWQTLLSSERDEMRPGFFYIYILIKIIIFKEDSSRNGGLDDSTIPAEDFSQAIVALVTAGFSGESWELSVYRLYTLAFEYNVSYISEEAKQKILEAKTENFQQAVDHLVKQLQQTSPGALQQKRGELAASEQKIKELTAEINQLDAQIEDYTEYSEAQERNRKKRLEISNLQREKDLHIIERDSLRKLLFINEKEINTSLVARELLDLFTIDQNRVLLTQHPEVLKPEYIAAIANTLTAAIAEEWPTTIRESLEPIIHWLIENYSENLDEENKTAFQQYLENRAE